MEETVWHPSQILERQPDGSMIITFKVTETYEILSWILGWGERVEVPAPEELREEVMQTAKAVVKIYRGKSRNFDRKCHRRGR